MSDRLAVALAWTKRLTANGYQQPKVVKGRVVWPKSTKTKKQA